VAERVYEGSVLNTHYMAVSSHFMRFRLFLHKKKKTNRITTSCGDFFKLLLFRCN